MEKVRKFFVESSLWTLVIAFVLFWVGAGVGMENLAIYSAFLVFVAASVLLVATPLPSDKEYCQYLKRKSKKTDNEEPVVIDVDICVRTMR